MRVIHEEGDTIRTLADDVYRADGPLQKRTGLMFRRPLRTGEAMVFPFDSVSHRDVHTLFVRDSIDVVWVAEEVVERVSTLTPWTLSAGARADFVIELPVGGADGVTVGDFVRMAYT